MPVSHLLPGKVSEVPSHIRKPMQDALQSVPLSDYSPLDHYSGAFDKLAVRLCCALPTSCTLAQSQGSDICGKSPSTVELVFLCTGFELLSMMPFDVTAAFHPRLLSINSVLCRAWYLKVWCAALPPLTLAQHLHQGILHSLFHIDKQHHLLP